MSSVEWGQGSSVEYHISKSSELFARARIRYDTMRYDTIQMRCLMRCGIRGKAGRRQLPLRYPKRASAHYQAPTYPRSGTALYCTSNQVPKQNSHECECEHSATFGRHLGNTQSSKTILLSLAILCKYECVHMEYGEGRSACCKVKSRYLHCRYRDIHYRAFPVYLALDVYTNSSTCND